MNKLTNDSSPVTMTGVFYDTMYAGGPLNKGEKEKQKLISSLRSEFVATCSVNGS